MCRRVRYPNHSGLDTIIGCPTFGGLCRPVALAARGERVESARDSGRWLPSSADVLLLEADAAGCVAGRDRLEECRTAQANGQSERAAGIKSACIRGIDRGGGFSFQWYVLFHLVGAVLGRGT